MITKRLKHLMSILFLTHTCMMSSATLADQTILIGLAGPLTGPSARIGKDLENGAQLAINAANAKHPKMGGQPVTFKLKSEDDQSDPRAAVIAAQRLVDSDVVGVIGHWNTGTSIPAARIYNNAGIAQIAPVSTGHAYTRQGFDTSFRIMGHDDDGGRLAGQYARQTLKATKIAVIDDRTAFGQGLADQFIQTVLANGGQIVTREYVDEKNVDFSAVLTNIRSQKPDLVFFGGVDVQAAPLVRRMKQLGIKAPLMGAGGFVSQTFLTLAGADAEGVIALEPGKVIEQMPAGKAFQDLYEDKFHTHIELHAPFAYDGVGLLISAIEQAQSTAPKDYLPILREGRYEGITGTIEFDTEGNLKHPAFTIYTVRGNSWVPVSVSNLKR